MCEYFCVASKIFSRSQFMSWRYFIESTNMHLLVPLIRVFPTLAHQISTRSMLSSVGLRQQSRRVVLLPSQFECRVFQAPRLRPISLGLDMKFFYSGIKVRTKILKVPPGIANNSSFNSARRILCRTSS